MGVVLVPMEYGTGVISAATELGIKLPTELSICSFDNFGLARKITAALTTATLPAGEMAEMATRQVIHTLELGQAGTIQASSGSQDVLHQANHIDEHPVHCVS